MSDMTSLDIVVPCFNEEEALPASARELKAILDAMKAEGLVSSRSRIRFVDDGSKDATWSIISRLSSEAPETFGGVKLSRNRGHQNAVLAGLMSSGCDAVITIDADLQDDPVVMKQMVRFFHEGKQIVYGVRADRTSDSTFKRSTAQSYYKVLSLLGVEIVYNHADYRLMGRAAIDALRAYPETNLFLRAIVPQLGFPFAFVTYSRVSRVAGESKYPLRRMLALALNGITSFSMKPLRLITAFGFLTSMAAFAVGTWALLASLFGFASLPGWASIVVPMMFFSGVQILSLGIIGEYVGKTYMEAKRRPPYIIEDIVGDDNRTVLD